ncbi:hypothetical protein MPTK1_7g03160 [Marchantia polymorpha subsp. ruderalis]|uniref:Uncharacterized protein n=2 Tax=Marchantia polymorpha TaxID=3197 RepID=A0AAF6BVM3_MARPO|nr:hypothetical protein MARPO_0074s0080 [Marchantia polymorpha]BBN16057.1 hypothetical protein Mp_7g03160 [Marchantia polymorpha subsp. ruderalis]|eukprot:PTQ35108.1 hypothetical protein MARPO_0074s0080 [Marchantia polymorpha]
MPSVLFLPDQRSRSLSLSLSLGVYWRSGARTAAVVLKICKDPRAGAWSEEVIVPRPGHAHLVNLRGLGRWGGGIVQRFCGEGGGGFGGARVVSRRDGSGVGESSKGRRARLLEWV